MKFKKGDRVRCHYNGNGTNGYVGSEGIILSVGQTSNSTYPYEVDFSRALFGDHELELVKKYKKVMTPIEKFALAFKSEPEKTFIKAGIMDTKGNLTSDGREIWTQWLVKKFGDDFKTEVVDKIMAEKDPD